MNKVITEKRNENTKDIDIVSTLEMVEMISKEDELVVSAIKKETKNIALAIDLIANAFKNGGRLYYFGAGTSGRLGVLDASECPPTFGVDRDLVTGVIAGGDSALRNAIEGAEDNFELGENDGKILSKNDVCVLISASGNPNYLIGVAKSARKTNSKIIALTCNPEAKIIALSDVKICPVVGAEVISGSSRLKAGSAQKMILNMLSTGAMIKIGKTYENFMIDVKPTNEKLKKRAIQIVCDLADVDEKKAEEILKKSYWQVKTAVVMINKNISFKKAKELLDKNSGVLRKIL